MPDPHASVDTLSVTSRSLDGSVVARMSRRDGFSLEFTDRAYRLSDHALAESITRAVAGCRAGCDTAKSRIVEALNAEADADTEPAAEPGPEQQRLLYKVDRAVSFSPAGQDRYGAAIGRCGR
ncbi:MAG: hypothetical protein ACRD0P_17785 [Stackebrandtia sp.]